MRVHKAAATDALLAHYQDWTLDISEGDSPFLALLGAAGTGKSTLFARMAEDQPHDNDRDRLRWVYLDLLEADGAAEEEGFWAALGEAFGDSDLFAGIAGRGVRATDKDLRAALDAAANTSPDDHRTMLVLDHWADARHGGGKARVHVPSLQTLTKAMQQRARSADRSLGCMIITRFPTTDMLVSWARRLADSSPGLFRLSREIERTFLPVSFPFLTRDASEQVLRGLGMHDDQAVRDIATFCGGWLALLVEGSLLHKGNGEFGPDQQQALVGFTFERLADPLLRWYPTKSGATRIMDGDDGRREQQVLDKIVRLSLTKPLIATEACIPFDYDNAPSGPFLVAPAVRANVSAPKYLVIDSENVVVSFYRDLMTPKGGKDLRTPEQKQAVEQTKRDVYAALGKIGMTDTLNEMAAALGVPPENVTVACRDRRRAEELFGGVDERWTLAHTALIGKEKSAKTKGVADNSDDSNGARWISGQAGRFPNAHFYVLGGDNDYIGNLGQEQDGNYTLLLPWKGDPAKMPNVYGAAERLGWDVKDQAFRLAGPDRYIPQNRAALFAAADAAEQRREAQAEQAPAEVPVFDADQISMIDDSLRKIEQLMKKAQGQA